MKEVKEIMLPDGWVVDKVENGKILLKEDYSKPVIKWNGEKNGVEVKADGYHFVVALMPKKLLSDWDGAKIICEKWGGYLPSVEELQVMVKYFKEINQCFENNGSFACLLHSSRGYWSSSECSFNRAHYVYMGNGDVFGYDKSNYLYVRAFLRA